MILMDTEGSDCWPWICLYKQQFERLFQYAQKVENLLYTIQPEEVPFQLGYSKMDLRKTLKASLSGVSFLYFPGLVLLK